MRNAQKTDGEPWRSWVECFLAVTWFQIRGCVHTEKIHHNSFVYCYACCTSIKVIFF